MVAYWLTSDQPAGGRTYNAPGETRTWRDAAEAIRLARPKTSRDDRRRARPRARDTVEDYDASAFEAAYGYKLRWPLEKGVRDTLDTYDLMREAVTPAPATKSQP